MNDENDAPSKSPFQQLRDSIAGFPSDQQVAMWKSQVPGGRIKCFCPDGKRVFFLRGLSGLELSQIQNAIPQNAKDPDAEIEITGSAHCLLWTNVGALDAEALRTGPAGLPKTLFAVVQNLSDFYD